MEKVFVFDVESIGLHGEGFAVGGGLYKIDGSPVFEFLHACKPDVADGTHRNRQWVRENVPDFLKEAKDPEVICFTALQVRQKFWHHYTKAKSDGAYIFSECGWPVEANFLRKCIQSDSDRLEFNGPYPLHDVATFLLAKGMNPMDTYPRLEKEIPKHNPLCDARQSMRLLLCANGTYDASTENLLK